MTTNINPTSMPSISRSSTTVSFASLSLEYSPILFPEIWLLVFPYLSIPDLRSVSLTCSTFRYMAQPHMFSVFDVSPFLLSYNAEQPTFRSNDYFQRLKQRIEYFKLPHIAHGVRHCWISPYTRSGFPMRNYQDNMEPALIIEAVLEVLPIFPNLASLSWHCIDITPDWWNTIASLRLKRLWLNSSAIPFSVSSPLSSIAHLDLDQWPWEGRVTNHVSIHEERSPGVGEVALQHIIQPDVILSISVPRADTASHLFSVLAQTKYGLKSLKVPFSSVSDPAFILALEQCPSLETLCIFPPSSDERPRDVKLNSMTSVLPCLKTYEGPYSQLLRFSPQPLENIALWGFDDTPAACSPAALVATLTELALTDTSTLRHLKVTVVDITPDLIDVFAAFRCLETIIIQSQDNTPRDMPLTHSLRSSPTVTALYKMLEKATLPPNVKYFKLSTRLASAKAELAVQEHEAARAMEAFASRHPMVQKMEIGYGIYWTGMYSAVWGRLRENCQVDLGTEGALTRTGGYESKSSSRDYILSTVVSSVHPLPLGKLTFTEHRRTILFPNDTSGVLGDDQMSDMGERHFFGFIWMRLRRLFGKGYGG